MNPACTGYAEIEGTRIFYVDEGAGRPVVMVHGSPVSSHSFRHQTARLARHARILAPDLPGFGRSRGSLRGASFLEQARMLGRLIEAWDLAAFDLVVHDWGGPIGLGAVSDRLEDLGRLVLINTTILPDFAPPLYWKLLVSSPVGGFMVRRMNLTSLVLPRIMKAARSGAEARVYLERLEEADAKAAVLALERLEGYRELMERLDGNLHRLRAPVFILWGLPDPYFRPGDLARLRGRFPHARVREIPGGGHFPQEDAAEEVGRALQEFILQDAGCRPRCF